MEEEAINPGYSNKIIPLGQPITRSSPVLIHGEGSREQFFKYEFSPHISKDFITVKATSWLMESANNYKEGAIPIIKDRCSYRLIKTYDFIAEELFCIIKIGTDRLINCFEKESSSWSKNRQIPDHPQLPQLKLKLEALVQELNLSK